VKVSLVSEKRIQERFLEDEAKTKYQVALFLVRAFPLLAWRLPPPRKSWEGEHRNMGIFDAVALALAYLGDTDKPATRGNFERR
jgi:hypothetical protein